MTMQLVIPINGSTSSAEIQNNHTTAAYEKIHFNYADEYAYINSINELTEAFEYMMNEHQVQKSSGHDRSMNGNLANEIMVSNVFMTIEFQSDIHQTSQYQLLMKQRENLHTIDDVHAWRMELNKYGRDYHQALVEKQLTMIDMPIYEHVQFMNYTPIVIFECDVNQLTSDYLLDVASVNVVKSIMLSDKVMDIANETYTTEISNGLTWNDALVDINATEVIDNRYFTGNGIRIGVLESLGICDVTHTNLANLTITKHTNTTGTTAHATMVTSILAEIAPDASYYVASTDDVGSPNYDLTWFLENGCDILNCSFSTQGQQSYRAIDSYFDYIIQTYCLTIVAAAGNISKTGMYVTSPGNGYNVITVGGVKRTTDSTGTYLEHHSGAAYASSSNAPVKPDISAPHAVYIPNIGEDSGTSYATPLVAASIALLYEKYNNYMPYPELTKSLLASTATKTNDHDNNHGGLDENVGAGCINVQRMLNSTHYVRKYSSVKTATNNEVISQSIQVNQGKTINIGLSWLIPTTTTSGSVANGEEYFTDYDIRLKLPNNIYITLPNNTTNSNLELVRYTTAATGTYTISVIQKSNQSIEIEDDCLLLTYNIQ